MPRFLRALGAIALAPGTRADPLAAQSTAVPAPAGKNDGRGFTTAAHDDVGFVRALIDTLGREVGIDPRRVYATGISNGTMFAYRLACDLPGTFAAVAPVAAAMPAELAPGGQRTTLS